MKRIAPCVAMLVLMLVLTACGETTPTPQPPTAQPPTATSVQATDTPVTPEDTPTSETTSSETPVPEEVTNIIKTVAAMNELSALSQNLIEADLVDKLGSAGPYTIFAPTNTAFDVLPAEIAGNPDLLFDLLLYHVVNQQLSAADAASQGVATSLLGDELLFTMGGGTLLVNGESLVEADIETTNGVIHLIDTALIPPTLGSE